MSKISNLALSTLTAISISGCGGLKPTVDSYTNQFSNKTLKIISQNDDIKINNFNKNNNLKNINKSIDLIGKNELSFFMDIFNISNGDEFDTKVSSIQNKFGLKIDGVIGPQTLKIIYLNYYAKLSKKYLNFDISKRLEIYNDMEGYKNHKGKVSKYGRIFPTKVPNIFSDNYYKGIGNGENLKGTFINTELSKYISNNIDKLGATAVLYKLKGNFFVAVYVEGKLTLLSYTSPGSPLIKGGIKTKEGNFVSKKEDMYYISGAKDSIINTGSGLKGAIMPYAIHVTGGIFAHAGYVTGKRRSHGCIRLPIFYAKGLHDIFLRSGSIKWLIKKS